jgi:CDP-diacylglycerol--serine O-phosphatidyltransferase
MIFDLLDGRVARFTRTSCRFGAEMDSLCDVISFGAAPALLAYSSITFARLGGGYPILDRYVWLLLAVYVACAALRLARFNIETDTDAHHDFFFGLPSPAAAGCLAAWTVMAHGKRELPEPLRGLFLNVHEWIPFCLPFFAFVLGVLMITRVRYVHIGEKLLRGRKSFMHLVGVLTVLALIAMQTEITLLIAFNGYFLLGLINTIRTGFDAESTPVGSNSPELSSPAVSIVAAEPPSSLTPFPHPLDTPSEKRPESQKP